MTLLIAVLATWRISSLLVREDGPFDIFALIRTVAGVKYDENSNAYSGNVFGKMLLCLWCTSIWVALAIVVSYGMTFLDIFAISAGAILVEALRKGGRNGSF